MIESAYYYNILKLHILQEQSMRYLLKSLYAKVIELFTNIGNKQYKLTISQLSSTR